MPPAFADWEDADHLVIEGAWRRHGLGVLQPAEPRRERNPTICSKEQCNLLRDYFVSPAGQVPCLVNILFEVNHVLLCTVHSKSIQTTGLTPHC